MLVSGAWWYDVNSTIGNNIDPAANSDMISPAFWLISGRNFKITRSDDPEHTALLQTTDECLEGKSFRHKMFSYGDFRDGKPWFANRCLGNCRVEYGGQYQSTQGFMQHNCTGGFQNPDMIGFWCDWYGDGSVMMIGGGGNGCLRADHGIGVTEIDDARFSYSSSYDDYGNYPGGVKDKQYALNLWIN